MESLVSPPSTLLKEMRLTPEQASFEPLQPYVPFLALPCAAWQPPAEQPAAGALQPAVEQLLSGA